MNRPYGESGFFERVYKQEARHESNISGFGWDTEQ